MKRVLVDLNLVLDVLLDRAPHVEYASALWACIESGQAEGLLAAHSVTTLHYLVSRAKGHTFADRCVADVLSVLAVAAVDGSVVREALALGWSDFEDAVCVRAAVASGCHLVATRDTRGFRGAPLPVLDALGALGALRAEP
jgi:predicted nucleic acid-binding protein